MLTGLVEKSLVVVEPGGEETRYRLLETTREYARLRLVEAGEEVEALRRHRDWYLVLAERAEPELRGPEQKLWLDRLEADYDNLRAALDWSEFEGRISRARRQEAVSRQDEPVGPPLPSADGLLPAGFEAALRLAAVLGGYWRSRGYHHREGRDRLTRLLAEVEGELPEMGAGEGLPTGPAGWDSRFEAGRARALHSAGVLANDVRDCEAAQGCFEASLAIARRLGDRRQEARSLLGLGLTQSHAGAFHEAAGLYEQALAIAREIGDTPIIAMALNNRGCVESSLGDRAAARSYYEEALHLQRSLGSPSGTALAASNLAGLLMEEGALDAAECLYQECLAIEQATGGSDAILYQMTNLIHVAAARGDEATARERLREFQEQVWAIPDLPADLIPRGFYTLGKELADAGHYSLAEPPLEESLRIWRERGDRSNMAQALWSLGHAARARGEHDAARGYYLDSLRTDPEGTSPKDQISVLEDLAAVEAERGRATRAARLLGAAEAVRATCELPRVVRQSGVYEQSCAAARAALGEERFAAAWEKGRSMTLNEAIRFALEEECCSPDSSPVPP